MEPVFSGIVGIRPFIPAKDYSVSRAFYQALGFGVDYSDDTVTILSLSGAAFILQNFYVEALANNCMVQLLVENLDAVWAGLGADAVAARHGAKAPIAPAMQHWGLRVGYVFDPSGVLWHVAERPRAA
jgi:predicted lactoylglutathione lyase